MSQHELELIVLRRAASLLAAPMFLVDPDGTLVYFNEAAEDVLGRRYEEVGEMAYDEWSVTFEPVDDDGAPIEADTLPLAIVVGDRQPAAQAMTIRGLDGVQRRVQVATLPLVGASGADLGSLAVLWERPV